MLRFRCDGSIEQGVFPHKQRERLSAASKFWLAQAHQTVPFTAGVWAVIGASLVLTVATSRTFVSVSQSHLI